MSKLKVAIYHNLPTGGAKRALFELVKNTNNSVGYDVYTPYEDNEDYMPLNDLVENVFTLQKQRKTFNRFAKNIFMSDVLFMNRYEKRVAEEINSKDYDLVFVHHSVELQSPTILRYIKHKKLYYMQEPRRVDYEYLLKKTSYRHSAISWLLSIPRRKFTRSMDSKNVHFADSIICNSYYSLESIIRAYGVVPRVNYLGVDTNTFRLGASIKKTNSLLCVGALDSFKQQMLLLESIKLLDLSNKPKIIFVYDRFSDTYKQQLIDFAKQNSIDLELRMRVTDAELAKIYRQVAATVCVASLEPFGFTPLESIACGTPAIAIKEGGYRETVTDGKNGLLVDRDKAEIAKAIKKVLDGTVKFDTTAEMFKYVENDWSWKSAASKLLTNYELIHEKNR